MEGEYIVIAGWPVQFLPADSDLLQEALVAAVDKNVDGMSARVFTAEHIAAIALQTGRAKDKAAYFNSSKLMPSILAGSGIFSRGTVRVAVGSNSSNSSSNKMKIDLERIGQRKRDFRRELAARPIAEKLRMLDALRQRTLAIRRAVKPSRETARRASTN